MTSTGALVLRLLRAGPQAPSELAEVLGLSVPEVHAHVERLRESGMDIALHPILGFELGDTPERLSAEDIVSRMEYCEWRQVETLGVTSSTNTVGLEYGLQGGVGPAAFFAERQTAGRGRFGRVWESEAGEGLWMSLVLQPPEPMMVWPRLTTIAALALAETIESSTPLTPLIKWPNDVVCREKKIAGILAETASHPQNGPFMVLGIGLNVNQTAFPEPLSDTAASLRMLGGSPLNRAALAAGLLTRLQKWIPMLGREFPPLLDRVKKRSSVLGKQLTADVGGVLVHGLAEDLDSDGCLILRLPDGSQKKLTAGEVTIRR